MEKDELLEKLETDFERELFAIVEKHAPNAIVNNRQRLALVKALAKKFSPPREAATRRKL